MIAVDEARRLITEQYIDGKITREEFENKKKFVDNISGKTTEEKENTGEKEVTYLGCIRDGFILSTISFLVFALYIFSQGWYLEAGGGVAFIILGIGLLFGLVFFTFIIFTPIVYFIRKFVIPNIL